MIRHRFETGPLDENPAPGPRAIRIPRFLTFFMAGTMILQA
jgi:hypothetical protein